MLRSILEFGLTRRRIVVLAVLVFLGAGLFAFTRLNIEAYPNPAPVILEITAQAPGQSAEGVRRLAQIELVASAQCPPPHAAQSRQEMRRLAAVEPGRVQPARQAEIGPRSDRGRADGQCITRLDAHRLPVGEFDRVPHCSARM